VGSIAGVAPSSDPSGHLLPHGEKKRAVTSRYTTTGPIDGNERSAYT